MAGIETEALQFDATGAPFSTRYGDVYASRGGALGQARHVFLGGNDLPSRWAGREQFVIVETGFGLGVNFLATWQTWREDPGRPRRLHFVSVERHPLLPAGLAGCAPPAMTALAAQLASRWPLPITGLHRLAFESGAVVLTLALGDAREWIPELALGADAFYLDGFAPDRNPEMWEAPLLKALARLARPGATLATWTAARSVQEALTAAGFEVELRPGFEAKRHMLTARYAPRFRTRRHEPASPYRGTREAVVLGAGLAGCASAATLARRGWQVQLIDATAEPAGGASALPCGLLHPWLTADDSHASRLARAGFLLARQHLAELRSPESLIKTCGVLQLADNAQPRWPDLLRLQRWPPEFVRWLSPQEAERAVGLRPRSGGLWFEAGAVVSAAAWCRAMLAGSAAVRWQGGRRALRIERHSSGVWRIEDGHGTIAQAPVVVVACAMDAPRLLQSQFARVRPVRGRLTRLAAGDLAALRAAISGQGTVAPTLDGRVVAGATYEEVAPGEEAGLAERTGHEGNLQRLAHLLAQPASVQIDRIDDAFTATRCVAHDRTPLAGAVADEHASLAASAELQGGHLADLPRRQGLYCSFALGSRGLTLAPLLGETLACLIEGEPLPIERCLARSVDPARFLLRRLRTTCAE